MFGRMTESGVLVKLIKFSAAHFRRNERGWAGAIGPGTLDRIYRIIRIQKISARRISILLEVGEATI